MSDNKCDSKEYLCEKDDHLLAIGRNKKIYLYVCVKDCVNFTNVHLCSFIVVFAKASVKKVLFLLKLTQFSTEMIMNV